jgi:hypothetical protein
MRVRLLIALLVVFLIGNRTIQTAQASEVCFGSKKRCIDGRIQEFWEGNGSWDLFGIPLEPASSVYPNGLIRTSQQFEKVRIEHQPSLFVPYDVFLGNIGIEWLTTFITTLAPLDAVQRTTLIPRSDACVTPSESEISVCGPFADFYMHTGINYDNNIFVARVEREAFFGKPITPAMLHLPTGLVVQVFEHLRLDYNPNTGQTFIGNANTELLAEGKSNLNFDLTPDLFMDVTDVAILPDQELVKYITTMPNQGYWESSQTDVYLAMTSPLYLSVFYDKPAKPGYRFITMSVLVRNQRPADGAPIYYDFSYIFLKDLEGRRYQTSVLAHKLALPVRATTLKPGESAVGQLIYEIPIDTAPAQLEMNFANMDEWVSRWETTFELRTWPLGVYD